MPIDEKILKRIHNNDVSLTQLNLRYKGLNDTDIIKLCEALKTNSFLINLYLTGNYIGNNGAQALAQITTLRELNLSYNQIGDVGAEYFFNNISLTMLSLGNNQISNNLLKQVNLHILENKKVFPSPQGPVTTYSFLRALLDAERAEHAQEKDLLISQIQQAENNLSAAQTQQLAVQELIDNTAQTLQEKDHELSVLHETRKQEVDATQAIILALERRLELNEKQIADKTVAIPDLQLQILEQEKQQLSAQFSSLKIRLQILETERDFFMLKQQAGQHDLTQLQTALENAKREMVLREKEYKSKLALAEKAGKDLEKSKQKVEHQIQLLEINLNMFKKHGLSPKERAFQNFLNNVKHLIPSSQIPQVCYISYAWEDLNTDAGKASNELLQTFLLRLERDLKTLGVGKVFLDINHMTGNTTDCMSTNIANSNCVLLIGTERLQQRVQISGTNVAKEWVAIEQRMQQNPNIVIPLLYQGEFTNTPPYTNAFPPGIERNLIRDCRAPDSYYDFMAKMISPMSFIRALFGIHLSGRNESLLDSYQLLWGNLETKFVNIDLELSNETLRASQNVPHYATATASSSSRSSSSSSTSSSTSSSVHGQWKGLAQNTPVAHINHNLTSYKNTQ